MATLIWDKIGERIYQTGVDRGVLYLKDDTVVPWNGIISVDESPNLELKSFYIDGIKYLEILSPGDYVGKLKAFTYPDEFDFVNGVAEYASGMNLNEQPSTSFNLSYRTKIGNDIVGIDHGYKIHILYNIIANPDSFAFETFKDSGVQPIEFSWNLTGIPVKFSGFKPMVHVTIDSTKTPPDILEKFEAMLYGTDEIEPKLPTIQQLAMFFGYLGALIITDHGDGTWSATDLSDEYFELYIKMLDSITFQIEHGDADYLNEDEYTISSTNVD